MLTWVTSFRNCVWEMLLAPEVRNWLKRRTIAKGIIDTFIPILARRCMYCGPGSVIWDEQVFCEHGTCKICAIYKSRVTIEKWTRVHWRLRIQGIRNVVILWSRTWVMIASTYDFLLTSNFPWAKSKRQSRTSITSRVSSALTPRKREIGSVVH